MGGKLGGILEHPKMVPGDIGGDIGAPQGGELGGRVEHPKMVPVRGLPILPVLSFPSAIVRRLLSVHLCSN